MVNKAFGNLLAAVDKLKTGGGYSDPNTGLFWKVDGDKAGNGMATIRFLPAASDDDVPFVKHYNHGFKNQAGRWFVENCATSIGQDCPVN